MHTYYFGSAIEKIYFLYHCTKAISVSVNYLQVAGIECNYVVCTHVMYPRVAMRKNGIVN